MILDEIISRKQEEVKIKSKRTPLDVLYEKANSAPPCIDLRSAVVRRDGIRLIAEIKKASPSAGIIRRDLDPEEMAKIYLKSGASAISVVTDTPFFMGSIQWIPEIKRCVDLPVLRKDFIIDTYQIWESRVYRADAILLIARILDKNQLMNFIKEARDLGMASVVEIHDEEDLSKACQASASIIGINNRDLETFVVNRSTTFQLLKKIPQSVVVISESGIRTRKDLEELEVKGVDAALVGEAILRSQNPELKIKELLTHQEKGEEFNQGFAL